MSGETFCVSYQILYDMKIDMSLTCWGEGGGGSLIHDSAHAVTLSEK